MKTTILVSLYCLECEFSQGLNYYEIDIFSVGREASMKHIIQPVRGNFFICR